MVPVEYPERVVPEPLAPQNRTVTQEQPRHAPQFDATIIIPAYNEKENIAAVVRSIQELPGTYDILVVDDCSSDGTGAIAKEAGARVLRHPYNKGNGASVKSGMRHALGPKVIIIDGDGQHPPDLIPHMVELLEVYDLVVGARTKSSETHWIRDLGNWVFNTFGSIVAGCPIPDLTSGFRGMRREVAMEFIHMFPNGFSLPTTSTLSVITAGYNIHYIPIVARRRKGLSKIKPLQDGLRFLYIIVRVAVNFKPMRVFGPLALIFFIMGIGSTLWYYQNANKTFNAYNVMLFIMSVQILLFGLIAEQIAALRFSLGKSQHFEKDKDESAS